MPSSVPSESATVVSPATPSTSVMPANETTPIKLLEQVNPIPTLLASTVKRKQSACVLTSPQNLYKKTDKLNLIKGHARKRKITGSGSEGASSTSQRDESSSSKDDNNVCVACWEHYFGTKKKIDWIKNMPKMAT